MLLSELSPPIPRLEEGKMHGGNTRAHEVSPSTTKQRTQEGCHDTRQGAQCSREFLSEIHSAHQGCHVSCDKFSSHTGNLNLQVWRWTHRENKPVVISYFIFLSSTTICIFNFYLSLSFIHNIFIYSFSIAYFVSPHCMS
jgi:hypothetical protein